MDHKYFFDDASKAFYCTDIHRIIPPDSVGVSDEEFKYYQVERSKGFKLSVSKGKVVLIDPEETSKSDKLRSIESYVQKHINTVCKSYGYDSIISAVTYADEPSVPKFQQEGQAFRAWRSKVWDKCYQLLSDWEAGAIEEQTPQQVIAQLPQLEL